MTAPLELVAPDGIASDAVVTALSGRFEVTDERPATRDRIFLDSFDGRLRAAGLTLEQAAGRRAGPLTLTLIDPGGPPRTAELTPPRSDRLLVEELPEGPLRERLAPVLEMRALLPQARVRSRVRPLHACNSDAKTVVRLAIEEPIVPGRGADAPPPLATRVHVTPLLGYDKAFERACDLLRRELGLKGADESLHDEAARVAGGRPEGVSAKTGIARGPRMRADAATAAICMRLAEVAEANLPGTLADLDSEFLHDFRVAVRRSRSMLREMRGVLDADARARAREALRWVQQITGPVRDLDVQLLEWPELVGALPAAAAADLEPLHALIVRHREREFKSMCRAVTGRQFETEWGAWRALIDTPLPHDPAPDRPNAARPIAAIAGARIRKVYRRMVREGDAIDADSPSEALHDLRKRGKELRYLLEHFGPLWPSRQVKPMVSSLKGLQDVLGRFQDRAVQAEFLRGLGPELAAGEGGSDALIALGLVIERLGADQDAARADFGERFAAFSSKENRALVKETFVS